MPLKGLFPGRALPDVLVSGQYRARYIGMFINDGECHWLADFRFDSQSGWRSRVRWQWLYVIEASGILIGLI